MSRIGAADKESIRAKVLRAVNEVEVTDVHTHLYTTDFGPLLLWGIEELITYHYLIAETVRWGVISAEDYFKLSKREQCDLIWRTLFIEHSPYSEACRGVLTVLERLGLDVSSRNLAEYREFFRKQKIEDYVDLVFKLSGVKTVVMTNDPFDDLERPVWLSKKKDDPRFRAALRLDALLNSWQTAVPVLNGWGYDVRPEMDAKTVSEVQRFLREWIERMDALYVAVSLPPSFAFPEDSPRGRLIRDCVLPVTAEKKIPFAMMIGVRKLLNPALRLAGDAVGRANIEAVDNLCLNYPGNKFLVTMLSRENQHELCVSARKFSNLMVFGCWWFLNNPSLIDEITRMRFETLGASVIPQHSDARILDQMIYKWAHSRAIIGEVLAEKYADLAATGWQVSDEEIRRDVADLFGGNFWSFIGRR